MATIIETKNLANLYDLPPVDCFAVTAPLDRGERTEGPVRYRALCILASGDLMD